MNLNKLFEMQRVLDEHIYEKHPELKGQDNLDWKILALQVELAECANEWRGFKKWSNNQEPRKKVEYLCVYCNGKGLVKPDDFSSGMPCEECEGNGKIGETNPLLQEYVDCLHFVLSIGLELGLTIKNLTVQKIGHRNITRVFSDLMLGAGTLLYPEGDKNSNYKNTFLRFIQLGELLEFNWEQVEAAYLEKNSINHERQNNGY